ncbi:LysM peptidoglycan-binding domain-containing protein [Archangium primigenium]|uniref:LysM peptidoglycan-binding domain-containing protein n=1 Tax=[Archangium] primigenium TaxID=2792470 RepID=UPI0019582DE5|nr:LysM peptidoglycan-binding domain-containing protein [Archangium primigenium]
MDTIEYRIRSGDTLSAIARRHGVSLAELSWLNGLSDVDRLWSGQVLRIPRTAPSAPPPVVASSTYRVRAGDTLSKVAERHGVSVETLVQANGIADANRIAIGQLLTIPSGRSQARPPSAWQAARIEATKTETSSTPVQVVKSEGPVTQAAESILYNAGREVMGFGRVRNEEGAILREKPGPAAFIQKRLSFNTRVFVSHELPGDWYFVALDDGCFGYVYTKHVSVHPPEPQAILYKIQPGEGALQVVKKHYKASALSWGQDERYYVNVLVESNRGKELRGIYKSSEDAAWDETRTRGKYVIWVPSPEFAKSLRGKVHSGSISHELWRDVTRAAVSVGDFLLGSAAFIAGVVHGILESLWDLLTGIIELVELLWKIVKSLLTGAFFEDLEKLWGLVEALDFNALIEVGLEAFRTRWYEPDLLRRWHFRGWVVGYAIAEIVMAVVTGSAALVKWAGKAGRFGKLIAKFPTVLNLARKVTTAADHVSAVTKAKLVRAIARASDELPTEKFLPKSGKGVVGSPVVKESLPTTSGKEVDARLAALKQSHAAAARAQRHYQKAIKQFRTSLRATLVTTYAGVDPKLLGDMVNLGYAAAKVGIRRFDVFLKEQRLKKAVEHVDLGKLDAKQLDELEAAFKRGVEQEAADVMTIARLEGHQLGKPTKSVLERIALRRAIPGSTDLFELKLRGGSKGLLADIDDKGIVELMVAAGKDSPLNGYKMFRAMVEHYGSKIKAIRGSWTYGDNLGEVNKLTATGKPLEVAIQETKTGQWAADWGFKKARVEHAQGTPGAYTVLHVLFEEDF